MDDNVEKVKEFIRGRDRLIGLFGMEILRLKEGESLVRMRVTDDHLMAAGLCHGGVIFSLADVAFALACNSRGTLAVALDVSISFLKGVHPGETLTARAIERSLGRSTGCYEISVTDGQDRLVALLKATAFRKNTPLLHP